MTGEPLHERGSSGKKSHGGLCEDFPKCTLFYFRFTTYFCFVHAFIPLTSLNPSYSFQSMQKYKRKFFVELVTSGENQ